MLRISASFADALKDSYRVVKLHRVKFEALRKQMRSIDSSFDEAERAKPVDFARWRSQIKNQEFVKQAEVRNF